MTASTRRILVGLVVAAAIVGAVAFYVARDTGPPIRGLAPITDQAFGANGALEVGPFRGAFSPNGLRLAVLSGDGLGLAQRGKVRGVTEPGSNVVDFAWMPGSNGLLVAEGPAEVGQLAVVDLEGKVLGVVPLKPSFGVGTGHGMTVARDGRRAVVTAVERPPLSTRERRHLVLVDLGTGEVRALTRSDELNEQDPVFVDATHVAYAAEGTGGVFSMALLDIDTSSSERLSAGDHAIAGITGERNLAVYQRERPGGDEVWRVLLGDRRLRQVADLPEGAWLEAVDPRGNRFLIGERIPVGRTTPGSGRSATAVRLRLLEP